MCVKWADEAGNPILSSEGRECCIYISAARGLEFVRKQQCMCSRTVAYGWVRTETQSSRRELFRLWSNGVQLAQVAQDDAVSFGGKCTKVRVGA